MTTELNEKPHPLAMLGLERSGGCFILGNFTEEVSLLGVGGQVLAGLAGVDFLLDVRDIIADVKNIDEAEKVQWEQVGIFLLDVCALFPIIGCLKYADEAAVLIKNADKLEYADEAAELAQNANKLEYADEAAELAKNADKLKYVDEAGELLTEGRKLADSGIKGLEDAVAEARKLEKELADGKLLDDVGKTSYGKSSLNSLENTENFTDSAIEHIFEGQVNARSKAVGYHYDRIEGTSGKIIHGTESSVNNFEVYKAQVEVDGIPKTANGGYSTFYSKDMSPQQVVDAINEAYSNCELRPGTRNTYQGVTNNGMQIDMFLDPNGNIISAFPKE